MHHLKSDTSIKNLFEVVLKTYLWMHLEYVVCMHMVNKVITSNSIIKTTAAQVEIQAEPNTSLTFIGSHFLRLSTLPQQPVRTAKLGSALR